MCNLCKWLFIALLLISDHTRDQVKCQVLCSCLIVYEVPVITLNFRSMKLYIAKVILLDWWYSFDVTKKLRQFRKWVLVKTKELFCNQRNLKFKDFLSNEMNYNYIAATNYPEGNLQTWTLLFMFWISFNWRRSNFFLKVIRLAIFHGFHNPEQNRIIQANKLTNWR